jgi:mRNA interferase YafQ
MPSKPAVSKRSLKPRQSSHTKQFEKDWDRLDASGHYQMADLKMVMLKIIARETLPPEHKDHPLTGEWGDCRDCHVHGDFLLIYRLDDKDHVTFVRTGTHSELFKGK